MNEDEKLCEGCVCYPCASCHFDNGLSCNSCPCDDCYLDEDTGKMTEFRLK